MLAETVTHAGNENSRTEMRHCRATEPEAVGQNPAELLRGLRQVDVVTSTHGYNTFDRDQPLRHRRRIARRFITLLA